MEILAIIMYGGLLLVLAVRVTLSLIRSGRTIRGKNGPNGQYGFLHHQKRNGCTLSQEWIEKKGAQYVKITLRTGLLLPPPLEIARTNYLFHGSRKRIRLETADCFVIDETLGNHELGSKVAAAIKELHRLCLGYSVHAQRITALYNPGTTPIGSYNTISGVMERLAALLSRVNSAVDIRLPFLLHVIQSRKSVHDIVLAFRYLAEHYPEDAGARRAARQALASPDFDVAVSAARTLRMDTLRFAISRFSQPAADNRSKAVRFIAGTGAAEGLNFILRVFPDQRVVSIRREMIRALAKYRDSRAEKQLCQALRDSPPQLSADIIRALCEIGGRSAAVRLHAFHEDKTRSRRLRLAADKALKAIVERLNSGVTGPGMLSLSGSASRDGGLSLAEGTGEDADD